MFWVVAGILLLVAWRVVRPYWRKRPTESEAILVTGCDSGFGFRIVKGLLKETDAQIFAGHITPEGEKQLKALGPKVTAVALDVTKDADVNAAFDAVEKSGKVLMGLVNNAGIGVYGWSEELSMEFYERVINTNVLGTIRVTKRALPLLRKSKGRLVTMGSIGCRMPSAFGSAYIPSKAAGGVFQDCVRMETWRFGMRCSLIEPGFFATGLRQRAAANGDAASKRPAGNAGQDAVKGAYESFEEKMKRTDESVKLVEQLNGGESGNERVVNAVLDALTTVSPRTRYLVGLDANILGRVGPLIPDWIQDLLQTYVI